MDLLDGDQTRTLKFMPGVSIADIVRAGQLDPFAGERALASAPTAEGFGRRALASAPTGGIAEHVLRAHEEAVARTQVKPQGRVTAEITFAPDIAAFELVPENHEAMDLLRALGPGAKITIHF